MIVYRLSKKVYASDLSGKGAELCGGRWNSRGMAMLYTCESRALCTTEIAVHTPLGILPTDFYIISIEIPASIKIKILANEELNEGWDIFPHSAITQKIGDNFLQENKYCVLKVPSAIVQDEYNYLLNPKHKDFNKIKIKNSKPFQFDKRLFIK